MSPLLRLTWEAPSWRITGPGVDVLADPLYVRDAVAAASATARRRYATAWPAEAREWRA